MAIEIPFERVGHFIRIPVGMPTGGLARFLVDTGIGVTVVSSAFAQLHRMKSTSTGRHFEGTRMAGDRVVVPLADLPAIALGDEQVRDSVVGVADLGAADGPEGFDGILGLDVLGDMPLTIDPFRCTVGLGGHPPPGGFTVPVTIERDGPSVALYTQLRLPDGTVLSAEVDTGSESTILDRRYMDNCGVTMHDADARTVQLVNETGLKVTRSFIPVPGPISLLEAPQTAAVGAIAMFQDLALDALVGTAFLDRYVQTFDARNSTMTLPPHTV